MVPYLPSTVASRDCELTRDKTCSQHATKPSCAASSFKHYIKISRCCLEHCQPGVKALTLLQYTVPAYSMQLSAGSSIDVPNRIQNMNDNQLALAACAFERCAILLFALFLQTSISRRSSFRHAVGSCISAAILFLQPWIYRTATQMYGLTLATAGCGTAWCILYWTFVEDSSRRPSVIEVLLSTHKQMLRGVVKVHQRALKQRPSSGQPQHHPIVPSRSHVCMLLREAAPTLLVVVDLRRGQPSLMPIRQRHVQQYAPPVLAGRRAQQQLCWKHCCNNCRRVLLSKVCLCLSGRSVAYSADRDHVLHHALGDHPRKPLPGVPRPDPLRHPDAHPRIQVACRCYKCWGALGRAMASVPASLFRGPWGCSCEWPLA